MSTAARCEWRPGRIERLALYQEAGKMPAPRGPGILPGASSLSLKRKLEPQPSKANCKRRPRGMQKNGAAWMHFLKISTLTPLIDDF
jgi:hypothetical protein